MVWLRAARAAAESGDSGGAPMPDVVGVVEEAGVGDVDADVVWGVDMVAGWEEDVAEPAARWSSRLCFWRRAPDAKRLVHPLYGHVYEPESAFVPWGLAYSTCFSEWVS